MIENKFPEGKEYTKFYTDNFDKNKAFSYHNKFFLRFEKNIKHYQQIKFIGKYLKNDMKWLDAPIGSGRLMDSLKTKYMYGIDISPTFIEFNENKGINLKLGDLFDLPFKNEFDIITCMHTLPAFNDFREILKQLIKSLKKGGILICDIVNRNHIDYIYSRNYEKLPYDSTLDKTEIYELFTRLNCKILDLIPHDFYDNRIYANLYQSNNFFIRKAYRFFNLIYFKFKMQKILDFFSKGRNEKKYAKYLVAVIKSA